VNLSARYRIVALQELPRQFCSRAFFFSGPIFGGSAISRYIFIRSRESASPSSRAFNRWSNLARSIFTVKPAILISSKIRLKRSGHLRRNGFPFYLQKCSTCRRIMASVKPDSYGIAAPGGIPAFAKFPMTALPSSEFPFMARIPICLLFTAFASKLTK
jgi:hypothetical protein